MIIARLQMLSVEELANTITHGLGLVLSIVGFAVLLLLAGTNGDKLSIGGCVVYGISLVVLYAASTVYHSTTSLKLKRKLQVADHCGIYLLIAGSYTPFGLLIIKGTLGQNLLAGMWAFAVTGILVKLILGPRYPIVSVTSYLVMGWIGAFAVGPLLDAIGWTAIELIVAGGLAYSLGVVFFPWKSIRHHHAIFHIFVLLGSILHYAAVVLYVVPYSARL